MADSSVETRIQSLEKGLAEIGLMCLKLSGQSLTVPASDSDPRVSPSAPTSGPGAPNAAMPIGAGVPLSQFMAGVQDLTLNERLQVVDAATRMLQEVFVHLPLKKAMHGIDPIQRLKLLRRRLQDEVSGKRPASTAAAFHAEMIEVFHSLRDLHTNYILPSPYQGQTAFLPFLVQEYVEGQPKRRKFVVTRVVPNAAPPTFKRGVLLTSWNGIPIDRAVELNAAREAGSNEDARHARGLDVLTLRPLALSAPPDEAWVIVGYESGGQILEQRFEWGVTTNPSAVAGIDADVGGVLGLVGDAGRVLGFDSAAVALQRAKKGIFFPDQIPTEHRMAAAMVTASGPAQGPSTGDFFALGGVGGATSAAALRFTSTPRPKRFESVFTATTAINSAAAAMATSPVAADNSQSVSLLPEFFAFRKVQTSNGEFGYIRIFSFMAQDANAFVAEFVRIAGLLPQNGLIIDVRGNGGGNILAGEQLLQVLTTRSIEPERFHFINTAATLEISGADPSLKRWTESIDASVVSAETWSQGFPLTDVTAANALGRKYPGKVVLLIDSLCYSTTDIFSAGFQDHEIGPILGTNSRTGAGGANVWTYGFFQELLNYPPLPKGVTFRSAIRRSTRVGAKDGVPLEDFGVAADQVHEMTRRDVLESNVDLIEAAAKLLV